MSRSSGILTIGGTSLITGVVVSLGLAVWCAAMSQITFDQETTCGWIEHENDPPPDPRWIDQTVDDTTDYFVSRGTGWGVDRTSFTVVYNYPGSESCVLTEPFAVEVRAGWPFRCLRGSKAYGNSRAWRLYDARQIRPARRDPWGAPQSTFVPTAPIHTGLAGNSLLFGGLFAFVVVTPRKLRACLRARCARCLTCGYPAGISPVCTECGRRREQGRTPARAFP